MKGVIFTEFVEMVEENFTLDVAEAMFEGLDLPSGGVYTSVGTYDHRELVALAFRLSELTKVPADVLLRDFGRGLFRRLTRAFPDFFRGATCASDFLEHVEDRIHVEARKLYPDAELPRLTFRRQDDAALEMRYESSRPFADLAEGLILGCGDHFGQALRVWRSGCEVGPGGTVTFTLVIEQEAAACCN